jgi:pantoate--beta-alanine ligase
MILFKKSVALAGYLFRLQSAGKKIGFVPTMGALHEGHLSLLNASRSANEITVCSIFINPTQFNDQNDFRKYPTNLEGDISLIEETGTDIIFLPDVSEIYPNGLTGLKHYDLGRLETLLEGKYRPGHFQGVCQVMNRLLDIVKPHNLYMGQKDYQQCMVVTRLLQLMQSDTVLNKCPTQREPGGLAMSSRNMRLSEAEKKEALSIFRVLKYCKDKLRPGSLGQIKLTGRQMLEEHHFRPDYVEISDAETLEPVSEWDGKQKIIALIAAYLNEVRLIDNMILSGR